MVWVLIAVLGIWTGLCGRLVYLHLFPSPKLIAASQGEHILKSDLPVARGRIFDARGNMLALDLPMKNVIADPKLTTNDHQKYNVAMKLAQTLNLDPAAILLRLEKPRSRYQVIQKYVTVETSTNLAALKLPGVFFEDASARHYPHGNAACQVLGFANLEGVGGAGIEQRLNELLTGRRGLRIGEQDGRRREIYARRGAEIEPQDGADVHLTLDLNVQFLVERALDEAMLVHQAKRAWCLVERVRTGEIIAMAARPNFDPNDYRNADTNAIKNLAISHTYEPGSTFKLATIAAALDAGTVTADQVFDCENGKWLYRGKILHDFHPAGRLSVADIIKKSSNIGAAKVALTLGEERLELYLRAFGFGNRLGVDLPGEEFGILRPVTDWTPLSISRIPMGHEVAVTALQLLNALCGVANDGRLMRPYLVARVVDAKGRVLRHGAPVQVGQPIREDTARLMRTLLIRATEPGGTATKACVAGYTVGGKTGTSVKFVNGQYDGRYNVASFCGFLPAEKPEIGIMVVVDEPQPLHTGGLVAAPIFSQIASNAVRCLQIPSSATLLAGAAEATGGPL
jgi:cell division protein FtsI (penicillin-binding protein 3)